MVHLTGKRVLVTGAGGFIGSHLVQALLPVAGKVTAMLHYDARADWGNLEFLSAEEQDAIEVVAADVTDAHAMRSLIRGQDIVFHLAALIGIPYSYRAPAAYFETNVLGAIHVLEACRDAGVERLIGTSTSECYGTALRVPIDEDHPLQAQSPYAASKIASDKAMESYACSFEMPVVIVRPFNTYGPRQSARAILPTIITQVLSEAPVIKLGSLEPTRDLTYAADTASGFIAAAQAQGVEGELFNLGVGHAVSIGELLELVFEISGIRKPVETDAQRVRPPRSEVMELLSDNRKAKERLGWQPQVDLREGIAQTVDFIRQHMDHYKNRRYAI